MTFIYFQKLMSNNKIKKTNIESCKFFKSLVRHIRLKTPHIKNYETQFLINLMLKDATETEKSIKERYKKNPS